MTLYSDITLKCVIFQELCTPDLPMPVQFPSSNLNARWNMIQFKRKYSFRCVIWPLRSWYSAIFGAPVLLVRARCLMHTIFSAPLHPHFGSYLSGWVTHTHNWHEHMCHSLFGTCACAHSTAAPARESMRKYYWCMHVSLRAGMPV